MTRQKEERIFDVELLQREKAENGKSLRGSKLSRRGQKFDPDQLDFFSAAQKQPPVDAVAVPQVANRETPDPERAPETVGGVGVAAIDAGSVPSHKPANERAGGLAHALIEVQEESKPSRDYRITEESKLGAGSLRDKAECNLEAIRLLKTLEQEARQATPDEKHVLARFCGWGAMPAVFDYYTGKKDEWNAIRDTVRALLTPDEHRAARATVPNAHYTSKLIIDAVWHALEHFGVAAGARILEPSCGTGNFFGLTPEWMLPRSLRAGVEIDTITAGIAKMLYPDATIYATGFEATQLPDNFFDVAVGNVPFGHYGVHDPSYKSWQTASIHNYFFVKTLDKLRVGGVLALITSRYSMDGNNAIRDHLSARADLLGAIRLPNTSFKDNAGTVVTTDIIFLQKRALGEARSGADWQELAEYKSDDSGSEFLINEYFVRHPHMMLGALKLIHGAYGLAPELIGDITRESLWTTIDERLPKSVYRPRDEITAGETVPSLLRAEGDLADVKNGAYVLVDGVLKQRQGHELNAVTQKPKVEARIRGMIKIRDCVREVFRTQLADESDETIVEAREELGRIYARFVRDCGCLSSKENRAAFRDDPDMPLLLSLEESYDEATGSAKKAAIFEKRTLERYRPVARVDTAAEALAVTLNEHGRLEWARMSALTGRSPPELQRELADLVYENPESGAWETADRYLSGNVRQKLATARQAAILDKKFVRNITALEAAQPTDLLPEEIAARLGATWIPTDDIGDFIAEVIDADRGAVRADYLGELASWVLTVKEAVKGSVANVTTYGTTRFTALDLIDDALNGKVPTAHDIIYLDGREQRKVNERQTLEAREVQQKLKDKFVTWLWADPERTNRLAKIYNETFNSMRLRVYDGAHLTFPGMNKTVLRDGDLAPHQKNAVWRILQGESTLLAHCVGAGKTWIMTAAAMEARRIGLTKKSMMVVPNHLVEQWGAAFLQLYPQANIFVAGKEHFQAGNREKAMARIATGDYDAVIVSHRSFELLPVSDALFDKYLAAELDALDEAIREASGDTHPRGGTRRIVKMLETARKRLATRIEDRAAREKKDNTISFEELGIDRIFVDEADLYKNLGFVTKMNRIAGLPQTTSNRATDMHLKTRWLRERNSGKGMVFATGTPISNTMAELYTMQRYLAPEALARAGMAAFDAWAANFGEAVTSLELAPDGAGYRMHTRFAKFVNLPELLTMFRDFADVQTPNMLNLPRPALRDGKNHIITSPATPTLKAYVKTLTARAEKVRAGDIDPSIDNMLKITSDGRKAALDMRLIDPSYGAQPQSKVRMATAEIFKIWSETAERKSTQLVFCDLSTPHPDRFHVYGAIRAALIELGVPSDEIAFIHDAESDAEKQTLFDKVNRSVVRILLGSTEKMGAGTNVQKKLYASHNIDAPWRPRDIEQRDGRILRQGNENSEVLIYRYVTEGSFDAYMWQTLETKARFIQQVMNGDTSVRTAEDIGGGALTYAEIKAIASGNPDVMEKVKVDTEVRKLDSLRSSHVRRQYEMRGKIGPTQSRIDANLDHLKKVQTDIATRDGNETKEFVMVVDGHAYSGRDARENAAAALNETIHAWRRNSALMTCARMDGLDVVSRGDFEGDVSVFLRGAATYNVNYNPENPIGTLMSVERSVRGLEDVQARLEAEILHDQKALAEYRLQSEKPFEHEVRLQELMIEQARLNTTLDLDKDDRQATVAGADPEKCSSADGDVRSDVVAVRNDQSVTPRTRRRRSMMPVPA